MESKVRKEISLGNMEARKKETERRSDKKESSQGLEDRKGKVEVAKNVLLGAIMLEQMLELYMRNSQEIVRNKEGGMWTEEIGRDNVWETAGGYWVEENYSTVWDRAGGNVLEDSQENRWASQIEIIEGYGLEDTQENSWASQMGIVGGMN